MWLHVCYFMHMQWFTKGFLSDIRTKSRTKSGTLKWNIYESFYPQTNKFLSDRQIWDIVTVLNTQSQLCHRAATRSYSAVIVSIHHHWVQTTVDVTSQDSSRSHQSMELSGWISNNTLNTLQQSLYWEFIMHFIDDCMVWGSIAD